VKVGIVGFGSMGHNHARVIQRIRTSEFIGFYDPEIKQDNSLSRYQKTSIEELIKSTPDYLVLSTPTPTHHRLILELLEFDIPLLVEKPICSSPRQSESLRQLSEVRELAIGVGHIERFNPAVREAKKIIDSGMLGKLISVDTFRKGPRPNRDLGVGVILDLMSHDIDTTMWISGQKYGKNEYRSISSKNLKTEDFAVFQGQTREGVIVRHQVDWLSPIKIRQSVFLGTTGMITVDTIGNKVKFSFSTNEGSTTKVLNSNPSSIEPLELEHLEFQEFISQKPSSIASLKDALDVVDVIFDVVKY
jgi:UDP-N-acetylglucosamine 3-dehydrogenase